MPPSCVLRPVASGDFDRWLPLWVGYNEFYGRVGPTALADRITELTWSRLFTESEPVHGFVAEAGDDLIGLVHYLFHRSTIADAPICYLQDLFTAEAARGHGVGRALIEAVYEAAVVAGSERVYWHTHETNVVAQRLYDQVADKPGVIVYRKDFLS